MQTVILSMCTANVNYYCVLRDIACCRTISFHKMADVWFCLSLIISTFIWALFNIFWFSVRFRSNFSFWAMTSTVSSFHANNNEFCHSVLISFEVYCLFCCCWCLNQVIKYYDFVFFQHFLITSSFVCFSVCSMIVMFQICLASTTLHPPIVVLILKVMTLIIGWI